MSFGKIVVDEQISRFSRHVEYLFKHVKLNYTDSSVVVVAKKRLLLVSFEMCSFVLFQICYISFEMNFTKIMFIY